MKRNISPPPAKRRKLSDAESIVEPTPAQTGLSPCNPETMRLMSWNINGITPFLQKSITSYFKQSAIPKTESIPPASLRGFLLRHKWPAVLFLQEVKIAASDTKTQDAVRTAVNDITATHENEGVEVGPKYDVRFTLPQDRYNARGLRGSGKVYGVATIYRSDLETLFKLSHIHSRTVDWDLEGRVHVLELCSDSLKVALFNIYAVNGTDNPYRDPATGAVVGTRHDRKLAFHRLLRDECAGLEKEGWRVVLAGDFNVAPDERDGWPKLRTFPKQHVVNRAEFLEKFFGRKKATDGKSQISATKEDWYGVDIWRETHRDVRGYTYYSRSREWGSSCDRVDYVIAGKSVWNEGRILDCGILNSEAERGPSDHCPVWADISMDLKLLKE